LSKGLVVILPARIILPVRFALNRLSAHLIAIAIISAHEVAQIILYKNSALKGGPNEIRE